MTETAHHRTSGRLRAILIVLGALILIVLVFFGLRLGVDVPNLAAGTVPEDPYERRYVEHPWLAYLHIVPGVIYLLGAPLQLSRRFRTRHYGVHRRLGRVLLGAALLSGVFALVFGVPFLAGRRDRRVRPVVLDLPRAGLPGGRWMIQASAVGGGRRNDPGLDRRVPGLRADDTKQRQGGYSLLATLNI